jgi:hypothetical protein
MEMAEEEEHLTKVKLKEESKRRGSIAITLDKFAGFNDFEPNSTFGNNNEGESLDTFYRSPSGAKSGNGDGMQSMRSNSGSGMRRVESDRTIALNMTSQFLEPPSTTPKGSKGGLHLGYKK